MGREEILGVANFATALGGSISQRQAEERQFQRQLERDRELIDRQVEFHERKLGIDQEALARLSETPAEKRRIAVENFEMLTKALIASRNKKTGKFDQATYNAWVEAGRDPSLNFNLKAMPTGRKAPRLGPAPGTPGGPPIIGKPLTTKERKALEKEVRLIESDIKFEQDSIPSDWDAYDPRRDDVENTIRKLQDERRDIREMIKAGKYPDTEPLLGPPSSLGTIESDEDREYRKQLRAEGFE
ncbi:MAG: hypothetical protein ACYTEQ_18985 [Planctomycetota bacterium]|jgi:hypothetical protein